MREDLRSRLQLVVGETYQIESELGGGGMSRVFVARETRLNRQVVIKVLPPEMAAGVNVDRFEREIQLAARLQHPHIVPLLTAGASGDLLYYVMPYIKGESLRAKLAREGELPIGEAVRILRDVTDALAHAHSEQVVHRDIKPDNVLISGHHALVTDFGVSKAVTESKGDGSLTSMGVALGTPAYMSPEQAAADPHVDHRADIYAVGALAYELFSGRPPFTGTSPQMILSAHVTQAPDPVTTHRGTVPPALNDLIMRCLSKKAADRYQRADEIRSMLEAMTTPTGGITPTGTTPVPDVDYGATARASHPLRVAALFGVAAAAALAIVYLLMMQLGLPGWVFPGAVALLAIGLPIVLVTGHRERQRSLARMTGISVTTPVGLARHFTWRKALMGGALAFAGLGIVTAAYMIMRVFGIGPAATLVASGALDERDFLIVAQFANRTNDSTLGLSLTEALKVGLSQSRVIDVADASVLGEALSRMGRDQRSGIDADLARDVAEREGIKAIVIPEVGPIGNGFVLSARLIDSDGAELVALAETAKDGSELIDAIGRLSGSLRERVGESLRTIRGTEGLERVTTSSLDALRLYSQGVRAFRANDYRTAIPLLEQAVSIDSTFAMAHRKLGQAVLNAGLGQFRAFESIRRAYQLRDRLTERERLITEGTYFGYVADGERLEAAYLALLESYPTDLTGLNNLGIHYRAQRDWDRAEDLLRRAVGVAPNLVIGYTNLILTQTYSGDYAAADSTLELLAARFSEEHPSVAQTRARMASARRDYADAERQFLAFREAQRGSRRWRAFANAWLADLTALQGRITEAESYQSEWEQEQLGRGVRSASLNRAIADGWRDVWIRNDPERGWTRVREAIDTTTTGVDPIYPATIARLAAAADHPDDARTWLDRMERFIDSLRVEHPDVAPENVGFLNQARGAVALAEGRVNEAIRYFRLYDDMIQCTNCALMDLAAAYDRAGEPDSVLAILERYVSANRLNAVQEDERYLPTALRRLGELYASRGDREKALGYYDRFVTLWRDADAELQPQVQEIRDRMALLSTEGN